MNYNMNEEEDVLEKYGRDITSLAKNNKIDPVIGRDDEIRSITRILCRKTKNNPVLIGEPGVGKSAIVEGLALRIINSDVPETLKNKKIWELDLAALVAGAKYQGEFEERLKKVLNKIKESNGNIIMFIDEIHMIVGSGREGTLNVGNMLKPMLARGEIKCIGATTLNEYHKFIEKDGALERRFQKITVGAPSVADTIAILRGLKERFEVYHGVSIKDKALIAAAVMSDRYITNRFLPDKAIDLVDEACATIKVQMDSVPASLDELTRKIMLLEIERESLRKEKDQQSKERLQTIDDELYELKLKENDLREKFKKEKSVNEKILDLKKQLDDLRYKLKEAENKYDLETAAVLRHGEIPNLEKQLEEFQKNNNNKLISDVVDEDGIASIISKWTNIPITKLTCGEKENLINLEANMKKRVIGQDVAINKVYNAILRSRSGITDPNKPIGSFLFLGPTGVGKTEVAKTLAYELFDDEKHLIRIDMSEYMEEFNVSRLIGAAPGYVGYEEGGQLTEAVRRNPYSIILFDEIEKAHPKVFNILLQILDDGRITDSQGVTVDFKNTIIIMTSNLGGEYILNNDDNKEVLINQELKNNFKPEFINRIDEIVYFNRLEKDSLYSILDKLLNDIQNRLFNMNVKIELTSELKNYIIDNSYDYAFGARPLKRFLSDTLENFIAKCIINGELENNKSYLFDIVNDTIYIKK